jgi:hypothetical protein
MAFGTLIASSKVLFCFMVSISFLALYLIHLALGNSDPTILDPTTFQYENLRENEVIREEISPLFNETQRSLIIWTSDFHISTVYDIKYLLSQFNVHVIDKSLSGHCYLTNTCQTDLHIITEVNGIDLSPCPNRLRTQFYEFYRNDPEFNSVDAFLCTHASSMCELYMPFGKPIIVVASTRFEIGRYEPKRWKTWISNLQKIASHDENTVAANNEYDREYLKYFTGLSSEKVHLLRSLCGYPGVEYHPLRSEILIGPSRGINSMIANEILSLSSSLDQQSQIQIKLLRDVYPHYEYADLTHHLAVILIPYQVSFMLFFELYSMFIPMYIPSPELLTDWHLSFGILSERTWDRVYGHPMNRSVLPRHSSWDEERAGGSQEEHMNYDPNSEFSKEAIHQWIQFSDFYRLPYVIQFHSLSHLQSLLESSSLSAELKMVSRRMKKYHMEERETQVKRGWEDVLNRIRHSRSSRHRSGQKEHPHRILRQTRGGHSIPSPRLNLNAALKAEYGFELADNCIEQYNVR